METKQTVNGAEFAKMIQAGTANLRVHAAQINDLNVFPIPDGDTGDNMLYTISGGADVANSASENLGEAAQGISEGMLLSARGNSGVILSQFFEGIAIGLSKQESADCKILAAALEEGVRHAYSAVMEPTEGTILTVMRMAAEYVVAHTPEDPAALLRCFIAEAKKALEKTPEMLPVLKKAGVVDSGGAGLICIMEGMLKGLTGEIEYMDAAPAAVQGQSLDLSLFTEDSVLEFGYCTELLLRLQRSKTDPEAFAVSTITEFLQTVGDSVVAFKTGTIVKIHVHTMTPDKVLCFCQQFGEFLKIKIENMSLQHNNIAAESEAEPEKAPVEKKQYGVVAVASGVGVQQMFADRGADIIVDGGQSMNPSAEDFIHAFDEAHAETIFVLPNNSNIVLTAKQAASMYTAADVRVIESHTVGDGYAALSMFSPGGDTEQIVEELTEAMQGVVTASVSRSVRDTAEVHSGEYIGFIGKDILASEPERSAAACKLVDQLPMGDYDICIMIRGAETTAEEAEAIGAYIDANYPGKEIYLIDGMQEIYDYILILE